MANHFQITAPLLALFVRDLNKLKTEISAYKTEANLWKLDGDILNTGGNLSLHLVGNLNHFIGAVLGKTSYVRHRDAEFSSKNVSRTTIISQIDETISMLKTVLPTITEDELNQPFPINVFGEPMSTGYFLIHLHSHLNYHFGQINYHRRLLD